MKGLIIKDLKIMSKNSRFMIIMLIISLMILLQKSEDGSFSFAIGYITMIGWLMSINTLAYDDSDKSIVFLMTLPSDRKAYVMEKYILSFVCCLTGCILATSISMIMGKQPIVDTVPQVAAILATYFIFSMIVIPLRLKMGSERSGVILMIFGVIIFASFGVFGNIIGRTASLNSISKIRNFVLHAADALSSMNKPLLYTVLCLVYIICFAVSLFISMSIMRKKEF